MPLLNSLKHRDNIGVSQSRENYIQEYHFSQIYNFIMTRINNLIRANIYSGQSPNRKWLRKWYKGFEKSDICQDVFHVVLKWFLTKFLISQKQDSKSQQLSVNIDLRSVSFLHIDVNSSPPGQNGRHLADDFSYAFLWIEIFVFWIKFHWSLFLWIPLTVTHHWFR